MRLCSPHIYCSAVWLPETDEIMHPSQLLCTPYGYWKVMRLCTCIIVIHPYGYQTLMRLCTLHSHYAYGYQKLMRLCTLHSHCAPVWLPETDEIMYPAQPLCTRTATGD